MPMIELRVLGRTDLRTADGAALNTLLAQPLPVALLAYMTIAKPGAYYRRDHLVGLFWPESDQEHARANLRKLLMTLRKSLGEEAIESRGDEVALVSGNIWCDAVEFETAFNAKWLARALELYDGPLLPGFFVQDGSAFEEWLESTRSRLADCAAAAAWSLAEKYEGDNQITEAARWARRTVEFAPEDERRLRRVISLLDRIGDRMGALRLYEKFRQRLEKEFRAVPAPETRTLIEQIRNR